MMPKPNAPPFFRCPNCNALYQVDRAKAGPETTISTVVPTARRRFGAPNPPSSPRHAELLALADELRPELHRYCARLMGSVIEGEDVVQDTAAPIGEKGEFVWRGTEEKVGT